MGTSFKTAPIDVRQQVAVPDDGLPTALGEMLAAEGVKEAVILSTCNRVEVYLDAKTDRLGSDALKGFFATRQGDAYDMEWYYLYRGMDVVQHAFRVVCSLDSQVLGEAQILGQMRAAFGMASAAGACGEVLGELFRRALGLGKRVRTETAIGADSVSLSSVAHQLACAAVDDLATCRVLIVGAGEMARLAGAYLKADGVGDLLVANRTQERARELAEEVGARVVPFEHLHEEAAMSDVVFTMTGAPFALLRRKPLEQARAAAGRDKAALVLVDEAVPRDIEPACAELPGVVLHDLESLSARVDGGLARRMGAVAQVERMAAEAEADYLAWMQERLVTPTIKAIRQKGELVVEGELERALAAMGKVHGCMVGEDERKILEAYGHAIMNKLLHGPTIRLRKEAGTADSYYYTGAARYLFGVETYPPGTHHGCHVRSCEENGVCPMGLQEPLVGLCREREARR